MRIMIVEVPRSHPGTGRSILAVSLMAILDVNSSGVAAHLCALKLLRTTLARASALRRSRPATA